jgi:glycosyltransferase involved in cell wall biosynthesis
MDASLASSDEPTPPAVIKHVTVCVCTYRRPVFLARLLRALAVQDTHNRLTYSVVVVDNDRNESARAVITDAQATFRVPITYCIEPNQSIARARNRAVAAARGDFIAFIDDDEFPVKDWLLTLFTTCINLGVDGVLGPVKPHFDAAPPDWLVRGHFHERENYPTGLRIDGAKGRTGNVLLKRSLFGQDEVAFRPEFVTGEDQDFFRRKIAAGHIFVWCSEAVAYEIVPPARWRRAFVLRRALMRGRYSVIEPPFGPLHIGKSLLAVALYTLALPLFAILGQHHFMRYLEKLCYHAGKLLACVHLNPVGNQYICE